MWIYRRHRAILILMGFAFWIRRFFTVYAGAFVIIGAVQLLKAGDLRYASAHAATWAAVSAAVFTAARLWQSRRGQHCAICRDTPEAG